MVKQDFSKVDDTHSFVSVPPGEYACRIVDVRVGNARDGSLRWSVRLEVLDGEYAGRTAAWDSLTWSERGIVRVKRVLAALGFGVDGPLELEAPDLVGRRARVQVVPEEYEDPLTGQRVERLRVPFLGWAPWNGDARGVDAQPTEAHARGDGTQEPDELDDSPF